MQLKITDPASTCQAGFVALPTESVYCMTKAVIAHLTKCLAVEWGRYNITVNAGAKEERAAAGSKA
jgi:NAD(P)-dependent dehydrogenase (short-subunit alcohol dehydrogenase family)